MLGVVRTELDLVSVLGSGWDETLSCWKDRANIFRKTCCNSPSGAVTNALQQIVAAVRPLGRQRDQFFDNQNLETLSPDLYCWIQKRFWVPHGFARLLLPSTPWVAFL